ncbi:GL18651 [Drosophila persimilis]|uniref:GL18651 n=1 Tax=Drosophila persimilis TaxID=7234 RepID=B4G9G8_DROPE|nr:GL18651 [Drosophila persimilis]
MKLIFVVFIIVALSGLSRALKDRFSISHTFSAGRRQHFVHHFGEPHTPTYQCQYQYQRQYEYKYECHIHM